VRLPRAIASALIGVLALGALSGCSVASVVTHSVHAAEAKVHDRDVEADLDATMRALEKYEADNGGTINGVTAKQLQKLGYMSRSEDRDFEIKTSTHVDFCLQATSPTGTTFHDHFGDGGDGGVAEGICREGYDYD
jgi:Tfp pilus assembly protein PilE